MSVATHLKMISTFDRWAHGNAPTNSLLEEALTFVQAQLPQATAIRLYHLNDQGVQLGAATESKTSTQTITLLFDGSAHTEALAHRHPAYDEARHVWLAPLNSDTSTFGMAEIPVYDAPADADHAALQRDWIALVMAQLGQALDTRKLRELARKQVQTSSELTQATTYHEIAAGLAKHLLQEKQFISINLFLYDEDGQFNGFRTLSTATRHRVIDTPTQLEGVTYADFGYPLNRIVDESRAFVVNHIRNVDTMKDNIKEWITQFKIRSACVMPMRAQGKTIGFIALNSKLDSLYLSDPEISLLQSLTDQVSTLVQLGRVNDQSGYSLDISERQKRAFNELVAGQNLIDMASIIARHMLPEPGRYLSIANLIYDDHGSLLNWHVVASANRNRSYSWDDYPMDVPLLEVANPLLNSIRDGEVFLVDDASEPIEGQVGEAFANLIRSQNVQSYLSIPILQDERPIAILTIYAREGGRSFSREEVNAFANIAGQMGVLVQVRQLLEQAHTDRDLVDNLVLANRLVMVASDYGYMAQAVMYSLAKNLTGAAITLFDQPLTEGEADSTPQYRQVIGMSTVDDVLSVSPQMQYSDIPTAAQRERLQNGQPVITEDLSADDGYLSPETRQLYREQGGNWAVSFGLRSGNELLGTLDVFSDAPYHLTPAEIDSYTSLADQIGVLIHSRQLLVESQNAQMLASQLVKTNLDVSSALTLGDMAQSVVNNLPETISHVLIILFNEPLSDNEVPKWNKLEVVATRDGVTYPDVIDYVPEDMEMSQSVGLLTLLSGNLVEVEDARKFPFKMLRKIIDHLTAQGLYSFLASGLKTGSRYLGFIAFGTQNYQQFKELSMPNIRAITSQIAVTLENRILVNQTADALSFVAQQYEVSNALYRASEPQKMLSVLFNFVQEYFTRARLGLIDADSDTARIIVNIDESGAPVSASRLTGALSSLPLTRDVLEKEFVIVGDDGHSLTLPLVQQGDQLIGVVQFINPHQAVTLPSNTLQALRSLTDQMTTSLQNRYLLQQMQDTLQETRTLYDINNALLATNEAVEVLQALYERVAPDADFISLTSLGYDASNSVLESYIVECIVSSDGGQNLGTDFSAVIGERPLQVFNQAWAKQGYEIEFAEDILKSEPFAPLQEFHQLMNISAISQIALPILEDGVLTQFVAIAYTTPKTFDAGTRRLYAAIRDQISIVLENQRLIRNTQAGAALLGVQVRVLQTLNQLAFNLSNAQSENELLQDAALAFYNALGLDHVGISMINPDGLSATVVADYPPHNVVGIQLEEDNELQVQIRNAKEPIYIADVSQAEGLAQASRDSLTALGINTMMLLPLIDSNNRYLGAVGMEFYEKGRQLTPEMMDIARTISAQVVVGLQNVRQVQLTRKQISQLQLLAAFSQSLQAQLNRASVLRTLVMEAPKILKSDHISVVLYDEEAQVLRLAIQLNNNTIFTRATSNFVITEDMTAGRTWTQLEAAYIPNLRKDLTLVHTFNTQMLSVMSAPIFARGKALGVLEISNVAPYAYSETDFIIFRQLASLIGAALENAETYDQSQRLARSRALVNEISSRIQKQVDLDGIVNITVEELGRALGAKQARVRLGASLDQDNKTEQW